MKKPSRLRKTFWIAVIALATPALAFAVPTSVKGLTDKLCSVAGLIFDIALIVGVVFVIVAAFKYMTAGGSAEKFKSANMSLIYAVIGLGVALVASSVPTITANVVEAQDPAFSTTCTL